MAPVSEFLCWYMMGPSLYYINLKIYEGKLKSNDKIIPIYDPLILIYYCIYSGIFFL